jgi:hypothetical protein
MKKLPQSAGAKAQNSRQRMHGEVSLAMHLFFGLISESRTNNE